MKAMEGSGNCPITGKAEVDETVYGGREHGVKDRENKKKKLVVVCTGKKKKGVKQLYARVIQKAGPKNPGRFMEGHIGSNTDITTDKWTGYQPLKNTFMNLDQIYSGDKGGNFPELHRVVMNLKRWLRSVHGHVNDLQDYLNEYCYRFNRGFMKENIFDDLLNA